MLNIPKLFHDVPADIMQGRQQWFWRRITLQIVLIALLAIHGFMTLGVIASTQNWPLFAIISVQLASIVWLVTMYYAEVNNADKLANVARSIGAAVGDAKDNVPTPTNVVQANT